MKKTTRTPEAEALTPLLLDIFRLNSLLLTEGDRLVKHLGITSARWRVLDAIEEAERPQPVAWLARDLGTNRQNVQRIVKDLQIRELVSLEPNPHHRSAPLVVLTAKGKTVYDEAMSVQPAWINELVSGIDLEDIQVTRRLITSLLEKLESGIGEATP